MKYTNEKLGFSFELPEGWREQAFVMPPTFISEDGVIQIKAATILPDFRSPAARQAFMAEPTCEFPEGAFCGDETENLVLMHDIRRREGWLSAMRAGIHYEVTWDHDERPGMQAAAKHIAKTFVFPAPGAAAAVERAEQMTPAQKVARIFSLALTGLRLWA